MQNNYAKIQAADAELIAISSDNENTTKTTVKNENLKFLVLSDKDRNTISEYNVVDRNNKRIARPASFIIKKDGTVAWTELNNVVDRVPTAEILSELGKL